jgi:hypothetical protein
MNGASQWKEKFLRHIGFSRLIFDLFWHVLTGASTKMNFKSHLAPHFPLNKGTRQGDPIQSLCHWNRGPESSSPLRPWVSRHADIVNVPHSSKHNFSARQ